MSSQLSFFFVSLLLYSLASSSSSASASATASFSTILDSHHDHGFPSVSSRMSYIPTGRIGFSAVIIKELYVFVIGGFNTTSRELIDIVDVYTLEGTFLFSLENRMLTPRGFMGIVAIKDEVILTIGGSSSLDSPSPLPTIEGLVLSSPKEGKWHNWGSLSAARLNPVCTPGLGGVVVAFGGNESLADWIDLTGFNDYPVTFPIPYDVSSCVGLGRLRGRTEEEEGVVFLCPGANPPAYILNSTETSGSSWLTCSNAQLSAFGDVVTPVDSSGTLFISTLSALNQPFGVPVNIFFTLSKGNVNVYQCSTNPCAGTILFTEESWVCLTSDNNTATDSSSADYYGDESYWSEYGGNSQRTGEATGNWTCYPIDGPSALLWAVLPSGIPLRGTGLSAPMNAVSSLDGIVYSILPNGSSTTLYALDGLTGDLKWSKSYELELLFDALTVNSKGIVFFALFDSSGQYLWALDSTGQEKWTTSIPYLDWMGLTFGLDNTLMLATISSIISLNTETGALVWSYSGFSQGLCPISVGLDGTLYYVSQSLNSVSVLNGGEFNTNWAYPLPSSGVCETSPVVGSNGMVYIVNSQFSISDTVLYAINSTTGELVWQLPLDNYRYTIISMPFSSPSLASDGTLFVGYINNLLAINGVTGETKWSRQPLSTTGFSKPVISPDGTIFVTAYVYLGAPNYLLFQVWALDTETGGVKWFTTIPEEDCPQAYFDVLPGQIPQEPVIGLNGTVYVTSCLTSILAFQGNQQLGIWNSSPILPVF